MTGFAGSPGAAVEPICSIRSTRSPSGLLIGAKVLIRARIRLHAGYHCARRRYADTGGRAAGAPMRVRQLVAGGCVARD
jgi:hypothetical protein